MICSKTYRSCYEGVGEFNGKVKYQILNSSGVSSLEWPEINGMYIFAATVVTRDYRYQCQPQKLMWRLREFSSPFAQLLSPDNSLCCEDLWSIRSCHPGLHTASDDLSHWDWDSCILLLSLQAEAQDVRLVSTL